MTTATLLGYYRWSGEADFSFFEYRQWAFPAPESLETRIGDLAPSENFALGECAIPREDSRRLQDLTRNQARRVYCMIYRNSGIFVFQIHKFGQKNAWIDLFTFFGILSTVWEGISYRSGSEA